MRFASNHLRVGLPVVVIAGVLAPQTSVGGELRNLISDLYGGDGIQPGASLPVGGQPGHHTFEVSFATQQGLAELNNEIGRNIVLAPFTSAATSIVFDIERGVPVRADESLGPLLLRRATTIGENRVSFGFSYTRADYKRFEGDDLDDLELEFVHTDCCANPPSPNDPAFEQDRITVDLDLELEQDVFAFFGTYGITNNWDVGAVVPVVHIDASVDSVATIENISGTGVHQFFPPGTPGSPDDTGIDSNSDDAAGIGDVALQSKFHFLRDQPVLPDVAVFGQVTLPTGDDNELLGTGETGFLGLLVGSKDFGRFNVHGNAGYELYTGSVRNNLRYGIGTDVLIVDGVTGIAEVVGRYEPNGDGTSDLVDGLVGVKWNPIGDVVLSGFVLAPINRDTGLRADFIWGLGVEFGF